MAAKRARWYEQFEGVEPKSLVFLDESGANTQMTRWRGRSPVGERLVGHVPQGHYKTTTLIAAMRLEGVQAPWLFEGPMNGEMFLAWVKEGLAPTLRKDDIVILDNLPTHKVKGVQKAIEEAGAQLLPLPPYSPDFNPIENMWSKTKTILRTREPRNKDQLIQAARAAFEAISPADIKGFFVHAQYAT